MNLFQQDLSENLKILMSQCGDILLKYFSRDFKVSLINNQFVTDIDLECEEFLKSELSKILPQAAFFAEESGQQGNDDFCWVIDPLDGTNNFIHGIPYFCISIALTFKGSPVIGCILDPIHKDFFFAQKGKGSYLNGDRIFVSKKQKMNECLIVMNFPCGNKYTDLIKNIRSECYSLRIMGATALDLAYTASSKFDAIIANKLKWWDLAAGMLIIEEAQGKITDFSGKTPNIDNTDIIAGSGIIHEKLLNFLR